MGKVKEHFTELQSQGLIPMPEPTKEDMPGFEGTWDGLNEITIEPSDDELAEIEHKLNSISWEDVVWEQVVTFYYNLI